tara:strand:- start:2645 stop:3415 length:771 start_codon:yes stop_codon:yes gene_type:complete
MAATCLSGTSGALYYKPAGTKGTFTPSKVTIGTEVITVDPFLNFKVGDPVKFSVINSATGEAGTGTLPAGLNDSSTFFVSSYTANTGALKVSASNGGSDVDITSTGTAASPNEFQVEYGAFESVTQVREWTFEIERAEIDVTTIGGTPGQNVKFREYIAGFGDGTGSATAYMTNEDTAMVNRMIQDVFQREQVGASFKLYIDQVFSGGTLSDTLSRSIEFPATLTSASMNVNPDDAQEVTINFRPAGDVNFDLSQT